MRRSAPILVSRHFGKFKDFFLHGHFNKYCTLTSFYGFIRFGHRSSTILSFFTWCLVNFTGLSLDYPPLSFVWSLFLFGGLPAILLAPVTRVRRSLMHWLIEATFCCWIFRTAVDLVQPDFVPLDLVLAVFDGIIPTFSSCLTTICRRFKQFCHIEHLVPYVWRQKVGFRQMYAAISPASLSVRRGHSFVATKWPVVRRLRLPVHHQPNQASWRWRRRRWRGSSGCHPSRLPYSTPFSWILRNLVILRSASRRNSFNNIAQFVDKPFELV